MCTRWVSPMLSEAHKQKRIHCAQEFLSEIDTENSEEFLDSIVTGNETWCHYVIPETKQQSCQWKHKNATKKVEKIEAEFVSR